MSSVSERRLRPIYDSLDCGNSKKALQEADRLLKKQPNFACAKVLRALALLRLERHDESRKIVEAVVAELPTDENSLQALTICYKELHEPEKICELYEAVVKKEPTNEEFLSHLFMAYVRVLNYKKQQQTAMALYKAYPKNPYYFWAVMSVLMQGMDADETSLMSRSVALQLAERLLLKMVSQNKLEVEAEVQLYLIVLEKQENYEGALNLLNGKLANLLRAPNLIKEKRAMYLQKLGRWKELTLFTQELIRQDPSQWSYYETHLEAMFAEIGCPAPVDNGDGAIPVSNENHTSTNNEPVNSNHTDKPDEPPADGQVENSEQKAAEGLTAPAEGGADGADAVGPAATARFLLQLRVAVDGRERAPLLAQLRLALALRQRRLPQPLPIDDLEEVVRFIRCYGDRPCCFSDVEPVLALVSGDQVSTLLELSHDTVELNDRGVPFSPAAMQRHLTWLQLCQHYSDSGRLGQTRLERAAELRRFHLATAHFSEGLLDTELRPNDHYLTLAVYCLYDEWRATRQTNHLLDALALLQCGMDSSPSNFYFKLAAIHIYHLLGAAGAAYTVYNTLDLKSIQLDTLSYVSSRHVAAQGQLAAAQLVFNTVLKFFNNVKDTTDCLIAAYKVGSFQQIPEFIELKRRLAHSANYLLTLTDCILLDLTSVASQHAQTLELLRYSSLCAAALSPVQWDQLRDNRDVAVLPAFSDTERRQRDAATALSWSQDLHLLRARQLTLRALVTVLRLAPPQNGDMEQVRQLAAQLAEAARPADPALLEDGTLQLSGPLPSRLPRLLRRPHLPLLSRLLETAADLVAGQTPTQAVNELLTLCERLAERPPADAGPAELFEEAALLTETVGVAAAVWGALHSWTAPTRPTGKRGKKKKGAAPAVTESECLHNRVVNALVALAQSTSRLVEETGASLTEQSAAQQLGHLSLGATAQEGTLRDAADAVRRQLENSYRSSQRELAKVLQYKVEYLTACLL
ncbi:N-alpha-acetyltransferase 25, NatB auxiliary subunit-like [Amphibalanus amphitrite]|uniref:N-alpha-acetyltransferase 25, NatB auxiliary subunit-like n=1 Tax=Amphibalanus amphitrite TaxID=1232801 RepID=UPI001C905FAE|nr:N-alpha-acetyltransferase 25, NatB auxiliary subunit-like [Amphibalanus amphitrite]XP_043224325.1 N-alpha-acetyltransferase 25, NatB auxiliary subunit-like [Amphibalanus amphitrite]